AAIDNNPQNLQNLITDFNTTANAFARQNVALENTVAALPKTLAAAIPAFNALNAAFPPLRTLAKALIPGVKTTGPMIDASLPLRPAYVEAVDFLPGLAGESRDFDANGPYVRILGTGGTLTYSLSPPSQPKLIGQSLQPIQAEQPVLPPGSKRPPLKPNVPC